MGSARDSMMSMIVSLVRSLEDLMNMSRRDCFSARALSARIPLLITVKTFLEISVLLAGRSRNGGRRISPQRSMSLRMRVLLISSSLEGF